MAGKSAIFTLRLVGDASQLRSTFDDTASASDRFKSGMNTASVAAGAALGGIAALAKTSGDAASALEQSSGAVASVFKGASDEVMALADNASTAVGLSKNQYAELASVLGAQLGNLGIAQDEVVGTTDDLITKGADLAATFGGETSDAVDALASLFRGERDPIEKYGVSIKQADVNAKLAAMGLEGLTGEAARQAETQATLALLTEQTADATGQFARETDSAAGSQQIANAAWEDAKAALGEALLPMMSEWAQMLADAARWAEENAGVIQTWAVIIGIAAVAIIGLNAVMTIASGLSGMVTVAKAIETGTLAANAAAWWAATWPILAVIAVIALVIAGVWLLVKNWDTVSAALVAGWNWVADAAGTAGGWISDAWASTWQGVADGWTWAISTIGNAFTWIGETAGNIMGGIVDAIQWVIDKLNELSRMTTGAWGNLWNAVTGAGTAAAAVPSAAAAAAVPAAATSTRSTPAALTRALTPAAVGGASAAPQRVVVDVNLNNGMVTDPVALGREIGRYLKVGGLAI